MKNNQYHKDLISEAEVKKNYWHNDSRIIKNLSQDTKTRNVLGEKKDWRKGRESDRRRISSKLREGTCYFCGKPGHNFTYCIKAASTPKDKWAFKILESTVSLFLI